MPSLTSYEMYNIVSCACCHFLRFFFCSIAEAFEDLLQAHRLVSQHWDLAHLALVAANALPKS